ncbi:MAG TPA: hypothetical protein VEY10_02920 [Flavisolibacter sp.]|jgi:hypothetical protein|nr:hypothetical protein [Flavisolibacter sp.]
MEPNVTTKEFAQKVMEGLQLAVKKVIEEARTDNQPLAVSINGKVELIYPS